MNKKFLIVFFLFFPLFSLGSKVSISNFTMQPISLKNRLNFFEEVSKLGKDKFILVSFAQTTCIPCKTEIPELIQLARSSKNGKVKLWIIFIENDENEIDNFFKEIKIQTKDLIIFSDFLGTSRDRLNIQVYPTSFLIDTNKSIIFDSYGLEEFDSFVSNIKNLLASKQK